jgi:exosome complex exonuclease RRP6
MEDTTPLQDLLNNLQQALIPPTRSAAQLPSASDLSFERTLSRSLARNLDAESTKILRLAQSLLNWTTADQTGSKPELDSDLIKDGEYSFLTLQVEQLLEHADEQIEKHLGTGKHKKQSKGAVGAKSFEEMEEKEKLKQKVERLPARLLHDSSLPKPQLLFTSRTKILPPTSVNDEEEDPVEIPLWKPILTNKVNPLDAEHAEGWLQTELYEPTSRFTAITDTKPPAYTRYLHPYRAELAQLKAPQTLLQLPQQEPPSIPKDSFDRIPFEWVGSIETLEKMVQEIRQMGEEGSKELAIDLEHHDFRSWSGFTCLIQVSPLRLLFSLRSSVDRAKIIIDCCSLVLA